MRIGHRAGAALASVAIGILGCGSVPSEPPRPSAAASTPAPPPAIAPGAAASSAPLPSPRPAAPIEPEGGRLKLAAWNIEWLTRRDARGERDEASFEALRRYAAELDADIVALQEVDGPEAARLVFDPGKYEFHFTSDRSNVQRAGFAWKRRLNVRPNPDLATLAIANRRPGADITVRWGSLQLRLLSVHLKSGCPRAPLTADDEDCRILREQLPALEAWVDARAREQVPFVVLGDFNRVFDGGDEFWRELDDADPPGADLTDAGEGVHPRCWQGRYERFIDHIVLSPLVVPRIVPGSFRELVYQAHGGAGERLSDHCPISLTLSAGAPVAADAPAANDAMEAVAASGAGPDARPDRAPLTPLEARAHVGEVATVCGTVASARYVKTGQRLTFLNLDAPYPDQPFTVVIRADDRPAFDRPEARLLHKRVCATGRIETYRGTPQIVASTRDQLAEPPEP